MVTNTTLTSSGAIIISTSSINSVGIQNGNGKFANTGTITISNSGSGSNGIVNEGAITNKSRSTFTIDSSGLVVNNGTFTNLPGSHYTNHGTFKGNSPRT